MTEQEIQNFLQMATMQQQANALQQIAMRPQKSWQTTSTTTNSTPYALDDMLRYRNIIGGATSRLNAALKPRESYLYSLGSALSALPQQQGPGSWLSAFGRGFGMGATARTNAAVDRAQKVYEAEMADLAQRLAYDKAMGEKQTQSQRQDMGYEEMPWGGAGGKGTGKNEEVAQARNYDISPVEMPDKKIEWGEREVQAIGRIDPQMGVRTPLGALVNKASERYNPEGKEALRANNNAYTDRFTIDRISRIAKATGGNRGIDTMPEVNLKGGPELSAMNMNSREFEKAVQDQAWSAADQIIKANPNATITREELANAFINDFNHGIRKEYRIVNLIKKDQPQDMAKPKKNVVSRYTNKPITRRSEDIAKKWGATIIE